MLSQNDLEQPLLVQDQKEEPVPTDILLDLELVNQKIATTEEELKLYYPDAYQKMLSEKNGKDSKAAITDQAALKLIADLKTYNASKEDFVQQAKAAQIEAQKSKERWGWFTKIFKGLELAGVISFVSGIWGEVVKLASFIGKNGAELFGKIGGPVALGAIFISVTAGLIKAIRDKNTPQRKTVIASSIITLGLLTVALLLALGGIVAAAVIAPVALPIVFAVIMTVGYFTQKAQIYQVQQNIKAKEVEEQNKLQEVNQAVVGATLQLANAHKPEAQKLNDEAKSLIREISQLENNENKDLILINRKKSELATTNKQLSIMIHKDPKVKRLSREYQAIKFQKEKLQLSEKYLKKAKDVSFWSILSVGLLIAGIAALGPVGAAIGGAILLGLVVKGVSDLYSSMRENENLDAKHKQQSQNHDQETIGIVQKSLDMRTVKDVGVANNASIQPIVSPKNAVSIDVKHEVGNAKVTSVPATMFSNANAQNAIAARAAVKSETQHQPLKRSASFSFG